jgi:hypothetical protein
VPMSTRAAVLALLVLIEPVFAPSPVPVPFPEGYRPAHLAATGEVQYRRCAHPGRQARPF